jgi:hypothetical protein
LPSSNQIRGDRIDAAGRGFRANQRRSDSRRSTGIAYHQRRLLRRGLAQDPGEIWGANEGSGKPDRSRSPLRRCAKDPMAPSRRHGARAVEAQSPHCNGSSSKLHQRTPRRRTPIRRLPPSWRRLIDDIIGLDPLPRIPGLTVQVDVRQVVDLPVRLLDELILGCQIPSADPLEEPAEMSGAAGRLHERPRRGG